MRILTVAGVSAVVLAAGVQARGWEAMAVGEEDKSGGWDIVEVSDGDVDTVVYHRTRTTVERVVVQRPSSLGGRLSPQYALAIAMDTGMPQASACGANNIVWIQSGQDRLDAVQKTKSEAERLFKYLRHEDFAQQLLDQAKMALASGREVAVVIDRASYEESSTGCRRPELVRLAVLEGPPE